MTLEASETIFHVGHSFKYDPFGRRIYKSSSSGTSVYAYDGDNLIEETNASGSVVARYTQTENIDEPLAMLRSAATSFYNADGLGSITSLTNAAGALAQTYTYDSFGKQTASAGSLTNPFQYTAREFDSETNLYYYRARYYDQSSGRFLNEDPLRWGGGVNFYEYAKNQPAIFTDPRGLAPNGKDDFGCLVCTVYAEARGLNSPCQWGVASVIINRLGEERAKGHRANICSIVSASGQFNGYGSHNYRNCINDCVPRRDRDDYNKTLKNFSQPFDTLTGADFFGNNTPAIRNYFEKTLNLTRVNVPLCPNLVFYASGNAQ